jgi:WhiB family redox-sensing transcriptional regulator
MAPASPNRRYDVEAAQTWMRDAACASVDPELFFPADGRHPATEAKRVCASCPVQPECLAYSLAGEEEFCIWGGLTEKERRQLLDERHRAAGSTDASDDEPRAS